MNASRSILRAAHLRNVLATQFQWVVQPLIIGAPMRVMSGPQMAFEVTRAGGLGFIGPGLKPESTGTDLDTVHGLLAAQTSAPSPPLEGTIPIGVGFQCWNGDIKVAAAAVKKYRPCAAWLFAPRNGQAELDEWTTRLRDACPETKIWIQVGTLREALGAAKSTTPPDVIVLQGAESGGHGRVADGMGITVLFPEVADALADYDIRLVAAGGIVDGRGVASAMALGAAGVAMGTRFLAAREARISKGYQDEVLRASDGATSTVRTQLYNHLRGTFGWPAPWSPRTIINKSWEEHRAGTPFEELQRRHDELLNNKGGGGGDAAWGPEGRTATYAGAAVGLVRDVRPAGVIVDEVRRSAREIMASLQAWE